MEDVLGELEQLILDIKIKEIKQMIADANFVCEVDRAMAEGDLARLEFLRDTTATFGGHPAVFLSSMERIFALYTETASIAILSGDTDGAKVVHENADKLVHLMNALIKAVITYMIDDDALASKAIKVTSDHIQREEGRFKEALAKSINEQPPKGGETLH